MPSLSLLIVVFAVVLGLFFQYAQKQQTPPPSFFSTPPCTDDGALVLSNSTIDPCQVYSEAYEEARQKFRAAATKANAQLHSLPIEVPASLKLFDSYTIDVAILPGQGDGLVVHTSGVHGVEGYAGSAIQIAFLENLYAQLEGKELLPTIVLIHAVNPFGMAHYRRFNENNVDLNRNGLHPEAWKENQPFMEGPNGIYQAYAKVHHLFNQKDPPHWWYVLVDFWIQFSQALWKYGFDNLKAALVTGQYYDPKALFFGGQQLQPSLQLLWDFFQTNLLSKEEEEKAGCCTGTVTWMDVHTGLGPSGVDSVLFGGNTNLDYEQPEAQKWFPGARIPHLHEDAKEVNKGYDKAKGFTPEFFSQLFGAQQSSYLGLVQEFGTVPAFLVGKAMIIENQAFQHLPPAEALEWSKSTTKWAFYKQTPKWRRQVLERGMQLLMQAIQRSSGASSR